MAEVYFDRAMKEFPSLYTDSKLNKADTRFSRLDRRGENKASHSPVIRAKLAFPLGVTKNDS